MATLVPHSTLERSMQPLGPMEAPDYVPPSRAISVIWRRKILIGAIALVISVPALAYILVLPRYYDAEATLTIGVRKTAFNDLQVNTGEAIGDTLTIRTQTDILNSNNMAGRVADAMDLVHTAPIREALNTPPSLFASLIAMIPQAKPPAEVDPPRSKSDSEHQAAIYWLRQHVTVVNDGRSYTLVIKVRSSDGSLSAKIANAYASQYLDFNRQLKVDAIARGRSLLDQQMAPLEQRVHAAEEAAERFREANGLTIQQPGTGDQAQGATLAEQQLAQLNRQLVVARSVQSEKDSALQQAQDSLRIGKPNEIPAVAASGLIQNLRTRAADMSSADAGMSQAAASQNPALRTTRAAMGELKDTIDREVKKVVATMANESAAAALNVASLSALLATTRAEVTEQAKARVNLRQLDSAAAAAQVVYRDFLGRYEQASSEAALQEPDANLITTAEAPLGPSGPPRLQLIALSILAGLGVGSTIALAVDRSKRGMRTLEQLEIQTGLFPLGFVPISKQRRPGQPGGGSLHTESINSIRRILRFGNEPTRAKVVLITSAARAEGKTHFATSLAGSVGEEGGRSLLIDCDIYSKKRHRSFETLGDAQQTAYAASGVLLREDALPGVDIMAFRKRHEMPASQFDPDKLREIIELGRKRYDLIVLDAPPVLAVANTAVMAQAADGTIVVVHWNQTPSVAVTSAIRTLQAYGVRILGGVLTKVRPNELGKGEGAYGHAFRNISGYFKA